MKKQRRQRVARELRAIRELLEEDILGPVEPAEDVMPPIVMAAIRRDKRQRPRIEVGFEMPAGVWPSPPLPPMPVMTPPREDDR